MNNYKDKCAEETLLHRKSIFPSQNDFRLLKAKMLKIWKENSGIIIDSHDNIPEKVDFLIELKNPYMYFCAGFFNSAYSINAIMFKNSASNIYISDESMSSRILTTNDNINQCIENYNALIEHKKFKIKRIYYLDGSTEIFEI